MTARSTIVASLFFVALGRPAQTLAQTSIDACAVEVERVAWFGPEATLETGVAVTGPEGRLRVGRGGIAADGTRVAAADLRLGASTSLFDVEATTLDRADSSEIRGRIAGHDPPGGTPACSVPALTCAGPDVTIAAGTSGEIPEGSYGSLVVERGARLELATGSYTFCSIRLEAESLLVAGTLAAVTVGVTGNLRLARRASIARACPLAQVAFRVAGERVEVGSGAHVAVPLAAPGARVRVHAGATIAAGLCAESLRSGSRVRASCAGMSPAWRFTDVTQAAGLGQTADYYEGPLDQQSELSRVAGGAAAADYDGDGWTDLFLVRGLAGNDLLMRNRADGTFEDVAASAGVAGSPARLSAAPVFTDLDGDGALDLFVGGILGAGPTVFRNLGDGTFDDWTAEAGFAVDYQTLSAAFGDIDGDGDLDAFLAHWLQPVVLGSARLWENTGGGRFADITEGAGVDPPPALFNLDFSFTPNFSDLDADGDLDVLLASDFGTSQVLLNDGGGGFTDATTPAISDENGMGAALLDYDRDGDLDWFVTSIWDANGIPEGNWGVTGNRLYRNIGGGAFEDATEEAGVRVGHWGWAACAADFNLDGHVDLFHTNGWSSDSATDYYSDPSVLYVNDGDGSFTERAAELGIDDRDQGRGVVCFDYDGDGDVDILVANNEGGGSRLYRNDGMEAARHLRVRLVGKPPNTQAIGARVTVTTAGSTQVRELRAGNNFESNDPTDAHFGLACAESADEVRVRWPDGNETVLERVSTDRALVIEEP